MDTEALALLNAYRQSLGLPSLAHHPTLQAKATAWVQRLVAAGSLSHSVLSDGAPDGWRKLGENVGRGGSLAVIQQAFQASPTHDAVLRGEFTHAAAAALSVDGVVWVAQEFASFSSTTGSATTMSSAQDVLRRAAAEIGYLESRNNWNKYAPIAGHPQNAAWCQTFLCAIGKQAGVALPHSSSSTLYTVDGFRAQGRWHTTPQPGDFAYFDFEGRLSLSGIQHVGIVESVSPDGRTVVCIEGNTSRADGANVNGGGVWRRLRARSYIVGYGRPAYSGSSAYVAPAAAEVDVVKSSSAVVGMAACAMGGYWECSANGGVFAFGGAPFHGSMGGQALNKSIVGMASTASGKGYWLVASDGGIFSFGDASFHGSTGNVKLNQPIVGIAATPTGRGYWLVARDGGIFNYGDAGFHGSTGDINLNAPIVGMAASRSGRGYWLVASDGGVFCFGDAKFDGSTGGIRLNKPVVGLAPDPDGDGYWLVASDGGIFSYDAPFHGSAGAVRLAQPVAGIVPTLTGQGYWLYARDGGVFCFGDAPYLGAVSGL
jgi:hypothetical protein